MAKRLKLVPFSDQSYKSFKDLPLPIEQGYVVSKSKTANEVLNDTDIPDDIKVQLYSQMTNSINKKINQMFSPISKKEKVTDKEKETVRKEPSSTSSSPIKSYPSQADRNLLEKLPIKFRPHALTIMNTLKPYPSLIKWNKKGTVTFFGSELVEGSNIIDLLSYVLRNLKWSKDPPGINRFLATCKLLNVPTSLLSAAIRKDWFGSLHHIRSRDSNTESAAQLPKFRQRILNWETIDPEDIITEDEDEPPKNNEEAFLSFD